MSRNWRVYLDDMRDHTRKVRQFTAGMARDAFFADERTYHAVIHRLQNVGEAAKLIPQDICELYATILGRKIAGMGNWLVHEYFGVNFDILWDVIENNVPELLETLERPLPGDASSPPSHQHATDLKTVPEQASIDSQETEGTTPSQQMP